MYFFSVIGFSNFTSLRIVSNEPKARQELLLNADGHNVCFPRGVTLKCFSFAHSVPGADRVSWSLRVTPPSVTHHREAPHQGRGTCRFCEVMGVPGDLHA